MGARHRHVLSRTKAGRSPTAVVGVSCECRYEMIEAKPGYERSLLVSWHAVSTIMGHRKGSGTKECSGTIAAEWWIQLDRLAASGGNILIVSDDATLHWCLLGLWEEVECGRSYFSETRHNGGDTDNHDVSENAGASAGNRRESRLLYRGSVPRVWSGSVILEAPPAIAHFRRHGTAASVRWIDVRNHAIPVNSLGNCPADRSREINRLVLMMSTELASRHLGALKDTSAAQAFHSFRHKHLDSIIYCHTVKEVLDLEQDALYSGRSEAHFIGHYPETVHELDMRGAYTYAMAHCPVPVRLVGYQLSPSTGETPGDGEIGRCCANVTLVSDTNAYPYRSRHGTIYPIGRWRTTLAGPELEHAHRNGRVAKWHRWAVYECEPALARFAREMSEIRDRFDDMREPNLSQWSKAISVSLVGKLAQRVRAWTWVPEKKPRIMWDQYYSRGIDGRVYRWQEIGGQHRREHPAGWGVDAVPAIAAWITSFQRVRLLDCMRVAGSSEVVYADTDSLWVTSTGRGRLRQAGWIELGELGFLEERGTYDGMDIRGHKSYTAGGRRRDAGLPRGTEQSDIDGGRVRQSIWASTYLSQGIRPGSDSKLTCWHRTTRYAHGTVTAGGRVEPIRVWED